MIHTILCILYVFSSFSHSTESNSFDNAHKIIMLEYKIINILKECQYASLFLHKPGLPVRSMLALDPTLFFQRMQKVRDYSFLVIFWYTFDTTNLFLGAHCFVSHFDLFSKLIIESNCHILMASKMVYHFKVYLMRKLFTYSEPSDREVFLNEAKTFFNTRLKHILRIFYGADHPVYRAMTRNFLFYQNCVHMVDVKPALLGEFSKYKLASEDRAQMEIRIENFSFLAGVLMWDRSSMYGLNLICDQTANFIGHFMVAQREQHELLRNNAILITRIKFHDIRLDLLGDLFKRLPIFDLPTEIIPSTKFRLLPNFNNDYKGIFEDDEIIHVAKTLFDKILLL
jgi:hypothetical protein